MPIFATGFEAGNPEYYRRSGWIIEDILAQEFNHRREGFGGDWCCGVNVSSSSNFLYTPVNIPRDGRWLHFWIDRGRDNWTIDFRLAFRVNGTSTFSVGFAGDGTVHLYRGVSTLVASSVDTVDFATGHWIAIEMVCANAGGICNVYVDDDVSAIVTFSGDTQGATPSDWEQVVWGTNGSQSAYIDDIIITDVAEGQISETYAKRVPLTSDQSTGLTPSSGSSNVVNVKDFDLTVYNSTTSATTEDLYGASGNVKVGDVDFVVVSALVANQADFQVQTAIRTGATTAYGTLTAAGTSDFGGILTFHLVDPDTTSAWTQSGIDGLQAGVRSGT